MKPSLKFSFALLLVILSSSDLAIAQRPELVVESGHSQQISSVAFSPDGKSFATASWDHTVKLWDASSGSQLRTLAGHTKQVSSIAFSPDGKTLASGGWDHLINFWDLGSGKLLSTIKIQRFSQITSVAFSPDGKILAGATDEAIYLWDVSSGTKLQSIWVTQNPLDKAKSFGLVAFSHDGKTLAGSINGGATSSVIKLWDLTSDLEKAILERRSTKTDPPSERATLTGHTNSISSLLFSPDDKILVSGSWDKTVKIWDLSSGKELKTIGNNAESIYSAALSNDGKLLAFADKGNIKIWDLTKNEEMRSIKQSASGVQINAIAFGADGKTLIGGVKDYHDNFTKTWDVESGAELLSSQNKRNEAKSIAFGPDGNRVLVGRRDLRLWGATDAEPRTLLNQSSEAFDAVAFSSDGTVVAGPDYSKTRFDIKLWNLTDERKSVVLTGHTNKVSALAFTPDGTVLISRSWDKSIIFWDVASGKIIRTLKMESATDKLAVSPDGIMLAIPQSDLSNTTITFLRISDGKKLQNLIQDKNFEIHDLSFSSDGKLLAGAGYHQARIWNVTTGDVVHVLKGHNQQVNSVAFSPDGKLLASGGADKTVRIWKVADGRLVQNFSSHAAEVNAVAFSPNGKILASGSDDTSVKFWDVVKGKELVTLLSTGMRDWLVVTPEGLFDGSPNAWKQLIWRFDSNTFNYVPVEAFFKEFYYPGLLQEMMQGKAPPLPDRDLSEVDIRQPSLKIFATETQAGSSRMQASSPAAVSTNERLIKVLVEISDNSKQPSRQSFPPTSGARDLRLFRNGSLVKVWRGDVLTKRRNVNLEATIPIVAGENRLTAYAFNHENVKSSDATVVINGAQNLKRPGTAYILAVGINEYSNPQYNLKYAVADAEAFAAEVQSQQSKLRQYARVEIISLNNSEATKSRILRSLGDLAERMQPEDAAILYFAGHGTAQRKRFYLIPHDLGYAGSRTQLDTTGLQNILTHSISDEELERAVEGIDAGQLLLVIDACNSGQALEAEEKRRGPMNSNGLAQLAYEKGMYILTAAQSYQAAVEAAKLGHGYLTYALVEEGLKSTMADSGPKDGQIFLREWLDYATNRVPQMQDEYIVVKRQLVQQGSQSSPAAPGTSSTDVQRPRVFYRREVEPQPLVVARP